MAEAAVSKPPAAKRSAPQPADDRAPLAFRFIDVLILLFALPLFLLAGIPLLGWAAGAGIWFLQRVIREFLESRARRSTDIRTVAGLTAGSMIARGWIVAGSIFVVGLSEREAGLSAAILAITLFTFYFTSQMLTRPFEEKP